ncbi:PD-(D/E)XK nuclease family protein [Herbivorax sp. ANBcel31]|uniref:PD-(D/E)XK nuclease family protein n=1 Tax=Herbivorax sp. ANBcel31 TaxID=3069754 RepID=UPI0027B6837E|nr:PD-(D/E)XK nuclease family protein [Herbivorax sp. ANBcel31]MDQ2087038.1 PD-(D/E)XK nuclease family protein [Herbivorax sp. ANBcel31]
MVNDLRFENYFLFTQHSLSTFDKCPLKFKKRYLENLKWDNYLGEEVRKRLEMGNNFHLMAYRYFQGIEPGLTEDVEGYEELDRWVSSLMRSFEKEDSKRYFPEYKLRMSKGVLRLEANYDLIIIDKDRIEVWDWKTHVKDKENSKKDEKFQRIRLERSLQTVVYLYVLKEEIKLLTGREIPSENINMYYWQPEPKRVLAEINYSDMMHSNFEKQLKEKIKKILEYDYSNFDKVLYKKSCKYCEFNWFCNNEKVDYKAMEEDEDFLDELEWDDIEELT